MNLTGIISVMDTHLKKYIPQSCAPLNAFGLAQRYYSDKEFYPGILSTGGEITKCFMQDQFAVSWYHINQTGTYTLSNQQQGDNNNNVIERNFVDLICYYDTKKTKLSGVNLKDIFIDAFPSTILPPVRETLGLTSCEMALVSHELDSNKVFKQEVNLEPQSVRAGVQHGLFSIRYEIITGYRRNCENVCEC